MAKIKEREKHKRTQSSFIKYERTEYEYYTPQSKRTIVRETWKNKYYIQL